MRPWLVITNDGEEVELDGPVAFLGWWKDNADRVATIIKPEYFAELDSLPVLELPRRSATSVPVASPWSAPRVEATGSRVPESEAASEQRTCTTTAAATPPSQERHTRGLGHPPTT